MPQEMNEAPKEDAGARDGGWRDAARQVIGQPNVEDDEDALSVEDVLEEEFELLHPESLNAAVDTAETRIRRWDFHPAQILELDRLAARLYTPDIREKIVGAERSIVAALHRARQLLPAANADTTAIQPVSRTSSEAAVSEDLNALLRQDIALLPEFLELPLPGVLRAAMERYKSSPTPQRQVRLNRQLLEFLFPTEVARSRDVRLTEFYAKARVENHAALCLSGGGIRSATLSLGVVQGFARHGILGRFDYLSTVSGGGYLGAWLTAWMAQVGRTQAARDLTEPPRAKIDGEPAPVRHLRTFSNFLSPKVGFLSADTWTLIATYLRNLLLTWLVLVPLLAAVTLAPYFALAVVRSRPEHWGVSWTWFLPGSLALLALLFGAAGVRFIHKNRPERNPEKADGRDTFLGRGQGAFLTRCLMPLVTSAILLTTAWIWANDWQTGLTLGMWTFATFGAGMHLLGYLTTGRGRHSLGGSRLDYFDRRRGWRAWVLVHSPIGRGWRDSDQFALEGRGLRDLSHADVPGHRARQREHLRWNQQPAVVRCGTRMVRPIQCLAPDRDRCMDRRKLIGASPTAANR